MVPGQSAARKTAAHTWASFRQSCPYLDGDDVLPRFASLAPDACVHHHRGRSRKLNPAPLFRSKKVAIPNLGDFSTAPGDSAFRAYYGLIAAAQGVQSDSLPAGFRMRFKLWRSG